MNSAEALTRRAWRRSPTCCTHFLLEQESFRSLRPKRMKSIKGALATAAGLPPNIAVEVSTQGALPKIYRSFRISWSDHGHGKALQTALADRLDLLAERARVTR